MKEEPRHGADGLSQERALVTGMMAANLVMRRLKKGRPVTVMRKNDPTLNCGSHP